MLATLDEFIKEDDRAGSTYRYRCSALLKSFPVGSEMHRVIDGHVKGTRKNSGNSNARNATDEEVHENNRSITALYKLPVGSCIWLLAQNQEFPEDTPPSIKSPNPKHGGKSY